VNGRKVVAKTLLPIRKTPCAYTQNTLRLYAKSPRLSAKTNGIFSSGYQGNRPLECQARKALKEPAGVFPGLRPGKTGVVTIALKGHKPITETLILLPLQGAATHHIKAQGIALGW